MSREIINRESWLVGPRGREVSKYKGTYYNDATIALLERNPGRMVSVVEISKMQFGDRGKDKDLIRYVARRLNDAINIMLYDEQRLAFLFYETFGRGRVIGAKLFDPKTDQKAFDRWLSRYVRREEQTSDKLARIELCLKAA